MSEWNPIVGEQVEITEACDFSEWIRVPLWVAGVRADREGLDVTVSEQWPIGDSGLTDGFHIRRPFNPDELRPLALPASPLAEDGGLVERLHAELIAWFESNTGFTAEDTDDRENVLAYYGGHWIGIDVLKLARFLAGPRSSRPYRRLSAAAKEE